MNALAPYKRQIAKIGQTIYTGDGRVIDENGKGIPAGFFYVDAQGTRLSQEFTTDAEGFFHWSIDDTSIANTFINFYASTDYIPVVLTPDEIVNNSTVILKFADKSKAGSATPWALLAGATVAGYLIFVRKSGRVSGVNLKERYNKLSPTTKKVLLYGGGGVAALLLIKYLFSHKPTPEQQGEIDAAKACLAQLAAEFGMFPTLSDSEFATMVAVIVKAADDCGTDETAIKTQLEKLSNDADVCKLIVVYGVRAYKGCFEGSYFGDIHNTLSQTLYSELSSSDISDINNGLIDKGIKYTF